MLVVVVLMTAAAALLTHRLGCCEVGAGMTVAHGVCFWHTRPFPLCSVGCVAQRCLPCHNTPCRLCAALPLSSLLFTAGALLRRQGDVHDLSVAVGLLTDALRYEPSSHVGWLNLGLARKAQGHDDEGERHLFTAVTLAAAAPAMNYRELPLMLA